MKNVEHIIRGVFMFLFGLTVGGASMWFMTINALKDIGQDNRTKRRVSYRDYYSDREIS
jgi:hypothetical protein